MTRPSRWVSRRLRLAVLREHGQALVEFAIVVPLLLLLVLGIVDFGLAYNYKNDQTSLANQALRYAVVNNCSPCGGQPIEDFIKSTSDSPELENGNPPGSFGVQQPGVTISFCLPEVSPGVQSTGAAGEPIEAAATSSYNWLPFLNLGNVTIKSTAIGRVEPGADYKSGGPNAYNTPLPPC
jgi:TadE-like protein